MKPMPYRVERLIHADLKRPELAGFISRYKNFISELGKYSGNDSYLLYAVGKEEWDAVIVCIESGGDELYCIKFYERFFKATSPGHLDALLDYTEREYITALESVGKGVDGFAPLTCLGYLKYTPNAKALTNKMRIYNYNSQCPEKRREELLALIETGVVDEGAASPAKAKYFNTIVNNTMAKVDSELCDTLVYIEDDKIVGMVIYEHRPELTFAVTSLVVDRAYRRRGIATALLDTIASIPHVIAKNHCSFLITNKPALALFTKSKLFQPSSILYSHNLNRENLLWNAGDKCGRVKRFDIA